MAKIYVCTGSCKGQSEQPGFCQTESCELRGQPLKEMYQCDKCGTVYPLNEQHVC